MAALAAAAAPGSWLRILLPVAADLRHPAPGQTIIFRARSFPMSRIVAAFSNMPPCFHLKLSSIALVLSLAASFVFAYPGIVSYAHIETTSAR